MEDVLGEPADAWPGRCAWVADQMLRAGMVKGALRYGIWDGPISRSAPVFGARDAARHCWIELPDGFVCDPTRWVFSNAKPYIYYGPCDYYDLGGMRLRAATRKRPVPLYAPTDKRVPLKLLPPARKHALKLLKASRGFTLPQVFWLANCDLRTLGEYATAIYMAIVEAGHIAMIPIDLREAVLAPVFSDYPKKSKQERL